VPKNLSSGPPSPAATAHIWRSGEPPSSALLRLSLRNALRGRPAFVDYCICVSSVLEDVDVLHADSAPPVGRLPGAAAPSAGASSSKTLASCHLRCAASCHRSMSSRRAWLPWPCKHRQYRVTAVPDVGGRCYRKSRSCSHACQAWLSRSIHQLPVSTPQHAAAWSRRCSNALTSVWSAMSGALPNTNNSSKNSLYSNANPICHFLSASKHDQPASESPRT